METEIGKKFDSFINSGYDHIHITPDTEAMRVINKIGLLDMGFPYYGWLMGIHTAVLRIDANEYPISIYSEDGEVEYGGDTKFKDKGVYNVDYQISRYMEGGYDKVIEKAKLQGLNDRQLFWFTYPKRRFKKIRS